METQTCPPNFSKQAKTMLVLMSIVGLATSVVGGLLILKMLSAPTPIIQPEIPVSWEIGAKGLGLFAALMGIVLAMNTFLKSHKINSLFARGEVEKAHKFSAYVQANTRNLMMLVGLNIFLFIYFVFEYSQK